MEQGDAQVSAVRASELSAADVLRAADEAVLAGHPCPERVRRVGDVA